MDPDVEIGYRVKEKSEAATSKENEIFAKELEDELMRFTTNYEEKGAGTHLVEQTQKIYKKTGMEVNIMECSRSGGNELVEAECSDATECSSSFDDSDYGAEGVDTLGESEALSGSHGNAESESDFDAFGRPLRMRKKLSSHWRSFIHPIMWRCKWAELQIKKLEAQARKYERKLEEYSRKSTLEGLDFKSLTSPQNHVGSEVVRRKKRRTAEAVADIATYMSHHNLFSYYENRKVIREVACHVLKNPDAAQEVNNDDESWGNDELLSVEAGNDDNFLEHILQKIEILHSQVVNMKTRVGKITREQSRKFSSMDNLSLPVAHSNSMNSSPNTAASPCTGCRMPMTTYIASQLISEYSMGGVLLPESAAADHREVVPDANGSNNHAHYAYAYGNEDDEVLIDNQWVREEMRHFDEVKIHSIQRPLVLKDGLDSTKPPVSAEPDLLSDDQPAPKLCFSSNLAAALKSMIPAESDIFRNDQSLPKVSSISNLTYPPKSIIPAKQDLLTDDQPPSEIHAISNLADAPKAKNKRGGRKGAVR